MKFTSDQREFIMSEIGLNLPADQDVKLNNETLETISTEAFYIEGEESVDDGPLSERGRIAESIIDLLAKSIN